ncbi:RNA pyrophosphohydrolase [Aquabacter spiritensis]|uniref:RNA pyrophosphohydrolase n=1 Tax=Aquabacter spiritensis TaxID=933073 RepID=A0A4R3LU62_9HYPH|nr:RNA pyrophosphohydrolase [Aquabacter spiritensis]TCT03139.1 putative (di)nucleoside polyphosphate hydrolase [Aquabacter spiritensis]
MARHLDDLPYRPCAGMAVFNSAGRVFMGERSGGPEHVDMTHSWQMPQGGIDKGEDPRDAALRELYEETSIRSVKLIGEIDDWLSYDLPGRIAGEAWRGKYRGQTQRWFAFAFTGSDSEIDIVKPGGGKHKAEFVAWRWEQLDRTADLVVPFKRPIYERVIREFRRFAGP